MAEVRNPSILQTIPFLIAVCLVALPAHAKYSGGTGEPNDPYQIATTADLIALGESPDDYDKQFILTADIDLDPNLPGRKVFDRAVIAPDRSQASGMRNYIGRAFTGSFDGNNHRIVRLTISNAKAHYVGLFGCVEATGRIRSLGIEAASVKGTNSIGGLAGQSNGRVTRCYARGKMSGGYRTGGLVGQNKGTITDCHTEIEVSGFGFGNQMHGGLVGENLGPILRSHAAGQVVGDSEVGGLIGHNSYGPVVWCHATCTVEGANSIGGLVGASFGHIANCYATGDVSVAAAEGPFPGLGLLAFCSGGLVGKLEGHMLQCFASGKVKGATDAGGLAGWTNLSTITNCGAVGPVSGKRSVGGLIGSSRKSIVANCYAAGRVSCDGQDNDLGGLVGSEMDSAIRRCFWDVESSGVPKSAGGNGFTTAQMHSPATFQAAGWDLVGERANGTADVWLLRDGRTYPELTALSETYQPRKLRGAGTPDDPYLIATAEDLGALCHYDWSACYRLTADVSLAGIVWTTAPVWGFAGTLDGAGFSIRNLTVRGSGCLGLFRWLYGAAVRNLAVRDAQIFGESGSENLGVLAAFNSGRLIGCRTDGVVSGDSACSRLGGFVGSNSGRIAGCYSSAAIIGGAGNNALGGLAGRTGGGSIIRSYAVGAVTAGEGSRKVGGLVGSREGGSVINSFWDVQTSGMQTSDNGLGLTTDQLKDAETFSRSDWAGDPNWLLQSKVDYPRLAWEGTVGQLIPRPSFDWLEGNGTAENPYRIARPDQLARISLTSALWDKSFVVTSDLDLAGLDMRSIGGSGQTVFKGTFDGKGRTVRNLTLGRADLPASYVGLFGVISGVVRCLRLEAVTIKGGQESQYIGMLVGNNSGLITQCHVEGTVSVGENSRLVGGLAGFNGGTIGASCAGGIVEAGSSSRDVGGLVGENTMRLSNCYAKVSVRTGQDSRSVGGLAGYNYYMVGGTTVAGVTTTYVSEGMIGNCYATGPVVGAGTCKDLGSLVGGHWQGTVAQSYFLFRSDGAAPPNDLGSGLTDEQMKQKSSFVGWDFDNTWRVAEGKDYPRLWWEGPTEEIRNSNFEIRNKLE